MNNKFILALIIIIAVAAGLFWLLAAWRCQMPGGRTFIENIGNESEKSDLIKVSQPRPNQTIASPLVIKGEARGNWYFEASFPVELLDENNNLVATAIAQAQSDWMVEDFVPFIAELNFALPVGETGFLVLKKDNPSGLAEHADELRIPVKFKKPAETVAVNVYFSNNKLDPEIFCTKVFLVQRQVAKTQAPARAALAELLAGTTQAEKDQGFFTSINPGVKIQNLTIAGGIAKVDFDKQLEFQLGGSCRVSAIRAQITETLKQFPIVDNVIISIDGRTEDILQP